MKLITKNTIDLDKHITIDLSINELLHIIAAIGESVPIERLATIQDYFGVQAEPKGFYEDLLAVLKESTGLEHIDR